MVLDTIWGDSDAICQGLSGQSRISVGGSVAPLLSEHATSAAYSVLAEEGQITTEEATLLRGSSDLLQALNGATEADAAVQAIEALQLSYGGLLKMGMVKEPSMNSRLLAHLQVGQEVLKVIVMIKN